MDDPIKNTEKPEAFVTWTDESGKQEALSKTADNLDAYDGVQKSLGGFRRSFLDIEPNRSVRTGFTREDYNRFRSEEAVPQKQKEAIQMCMTAYDKVGIIRNVIDLMGDFACHGINIVHPNKRIEKFYKKWFEKIGGKDRSERFLNILYRCGNVIVKRRTAKISKKIENDLKKSLGAPDMSIEKLKVAKREIPWQHDFLNPLSIEILGDQLAAFVGKKQYAIRVSKMVRGLARRAVLGDSKYNSNLVSQLPPDILAAINSGQDIIPLDPDKLSVFHYKKDDWLLWANPMIYAILDDVIMLEKMKLADVSALDGAISNIRLWSLGDLDNKILPTKNAINKLRNILASNVGGGTMDLVWGPELKFTESSTQVYRFLGKEKYEPVLTNIYAGLGIPPTLTGAAGGGGGFTNNFVSLKTLVERLEYGRSILLSFWREEIERVRQAMGFRLPAQVHFDQMVLADESTEKNLLIQLADRNIISAETIVERFGELPEIEKIRIRREDRERKKEIIPQQAGPYHNPQHRNDLEKIALTKDMIAPEDVGVVPCENTGPHPFSDPDDRRSDEQIEEKKGELQDKQDERDEKKFDHQQERQQEFEPKGRPEDGRPKFAKDKQKRKQKEVKPRAAAGYEFFNLTLWASGAQKTVADIVHKPLLAFYDKKNIRSLTKKQADELEYIKLCILCNLEPYVEIDADIINTILKNQGRADADTFNIVSNFKKDFVKKNGRNPTVEESRQIHVSAYAVVRNS